MPSLAPTLSELEGQLFEVEIEAGMFRKAIKAGKIEVDNLKRAKSDAVSGLKKAEINLQELVAAPVVSLVECHNVRSLCKALKSRIEVSQLNLDVAADSLQKLEKRLAEAERQQEKLTETIKNHNNILRFPTNDIRRSEETSE